MINGSSAGRAQVAAVHVAASARACRWACRRAANIDYSTDVTTQQLYSNNFYDATTSRRTLNGGVGGAWGGLSVNSVYTSHRVLLQRHRFAGQRPSAPGFSAGLQRPQATAATGLTFRSTPMRQARALRHQGEGRDRRQEPEPGRLRALGARAAQHAAVPDRERHHRRIGRTYFSESLADDERTQIEEPVTRRYADLRADVVGPVFSRVFNPNNAFADRLKHVIEPSFSVQRRTTIEGQDHIPNQRPPTTPSLAERRSSRTAWPTGCCAREGSRGRASRSPRRLLNVSIRQSYYSDETASQFDPQLRQQPGAAAQSVFADHGVGEGDPDPADGCRLPARLRSAQRSRL